MLVRTCLILCVLFGAVSNSWASEDALDNSTSTPTIESTIAPSVEPVSEPSSPMQLPSAAYLGAEINKTIGRDVKLFNFGAMYLGQVLVYVGTQHETITDHGSFDKMYKNMFSPVYDRDDFSYNVFKHSLSGMIYYEYYRYRGYSEVDAFKWTFLSSLAFEFAIETYTEKPSFQDIYQTPVFGTILGMMMESSSNKLLESNFVFLRALGYIVNPFAMLPKLDIYSIPFVSKNSVGYNVVWSF